MISLSPSTTDVVIALGERKALVGVDQYSQVLSGIGELPSLGGLFAPDLERTLELRPTLVLGVRSESMAAQLCSGPLGEFRHMLEAIDPPGPIQLAGAGQDHR